VLALSFTSSVTLRAQVVTARTAEALDESAITAAEANLRTRPTRAHQLSPAAQAGF